MTFKIILRPEAEADLSKTYLWYDEIRPGLGRDFLRSVDASLASAQRYPFSFPRTHKQIRRALLRRFPYGLFYFVHKRNIIVLACFHFKRDPQQILVRLQ